MSSDSISSPESFKKIRDKIARSPKVTKPKKSIKKFPFWNKRTIFGTLIIAACAISSEYFARNRKNQLSEQQKWNAEFVAKSFDSVLSKLKSMEADFLKQKEIQQQEMKVVAAKMDSLLEKIFDLEKDDLKVKIEKLLKTNAAEIRQEIRDILIEILQLDKNMEATKKAVKNMESSYAVYKARSEFMDFARSFNPNEKIQVPQLEESF